MDRKLGGCFVGLMMLLMLCVSTGFAQESEQNNYSYYRTTQSFAFARQSAEAVSVGIGNDASAEVVEAMDCVCLRANGYAEYYVNIPQDGQYCLDILYHALPGTSRNPEIAVTVDGADPFLEAGFCVLPRLWQDDGDFTYDNNGNQLRPTQKEIMRWQNEILYDYDGVSDGPFLFSFTKGEHLIRVTALSEPVAIAALTAAAPPAEAPAYAVLQERYRELGYHPADKAIYLEQAAETPTLRYALWPLAESDYSTPSTKPSSPSKIVYNVLGGEQWVFIDQKVEWTFDVAQAGLYQISFKYRQNYSRGMEAYRQVLVDGVLPCAEMRSVAFPYCTDWQNLTVSDDAGAPLMIYFDQGSHTVSLNPSILPLSDLLGVLEDTVYSLNAWYRKILTITSASPDLYRDYYLDKEIPGMIEDFARLAMLLRATADEAEKRLGIEGSELSTMYEVAIQLESFVERADRIPRRLSEFKSNISALTELRQSLIELPMQLDYLSLSGENCALPAPNKSFFELLGFRLQAFFASFTEDYDAVGNIYDEADSREPLNVWVSVNDMASTGSSSGRDHMTLLKQLIDEQFVSSTGIPVNVSLVNSSATLTQAIVAGIGPDVALIVPGGTPVTLAMRGALQDLSEFDLSGIRDEFYDGAFTPYEYDGGVYALPETQTFSMLFYRTDVFADLGIRVPETWDDFYRIVPIIQKKNLQIGFGEDLSLFATLVMQLGGSYYAEDLSATGFDSPEAIAAFRQWTELYTKYSFPVYFDGFNRFRTGEIPLLLSNFTFYCTLEAAAPELRGLWAMAPLPGTIREDNRVDRSQSGGGTCCIMMNNLPNKEDAFTFLKWWVSADVQAQYGNLLEGTMGISARYPTANKVAFQSLMWKESEKRELAAQWSAIKPLANIPGGYYVSRCLTNAFRRVVYYYDNPRETLLRYDLQMNREITRKRVEYGLEDAKP